MKKNKIENFVYIILLIFLTLFFNFFENVFLVSKYSYEKRLIFNYGYCEKTSYGFIKYINEKYKLEKNIPIYNDDISVPYSEAFIHKPKQEYYEKFIIILNYNEKNSKIKMENYSVIEKFKNCFYLKKNG